MISNKHLKFVDKELYDAIELEKGRQNDQIELIASENYVSRAVLEAVGSPLTNKYAEGYPSHRYYGGCEYVDIAESLAIERVKKIYGCKYANVQPHSGASANFAVYLALLNPGDTIMGMNLSDGGHLTHGCKVNVSGKFFNSVCYGVNEKGLIDYANVRKLALEYKPKLIVAGASAYSRKIDWEKFRKIADEVGAYLMVDMAHIAGLVAAGLHKSPLPYADVVTSTTHKTLRGPRGGIILTNNEELAKKIDKAVFPGSQGGPLMHVIAGKAVAFHEALQPSFKRYQRQIIRNARTLANRLLENGVKLVSNGTDNHLMLIDLSDRDMTGKELETLLHEANISANKNTVPNEKRSPFITSGLRIGTPACTTRGFKEPEMVEIADIIADIINKGEKAVSRSKKKVQSICEKFPVKY